MITRTTALAAVLSLIVGGTAALGQGPAQPPGAGTQPFPSPAAPAAEVSEHDREFVQKAAQGNMLEIQLGKIAQSNAASPSVREFAQQMVKDHSQAAEQFKQIAKKIGLNPPGSLPERLQNLVSSMADLPPGRFDEQYMWNLVAAHYGGGERIRGADRARQKPDARRVCSEDCAQTPRTSATCGVHLEPRELTRRE